MYEMEGPRLAAQRFSEPIARLAPALRAPAGASHPLELAGFPAVPRVPGVSPEPVPVSSGEAVLLRLERPAQGLQDTKSMIL